MAIDGTKEVALVLLFKVPPHMKPEQVSAMIATSGVSVALGLHEYLKSSTATVVDVTPGGKGSDASRLIGM